jgi:hypothetical protein
VGGRLGVGHGRWLASIGFEELRRMLARRADEDAGDFLEIRFDKLGYKPNVVDEELKDRVITAGCPYGTVTIVFDRFGQLRSLDIC